MNRDFEKDCLMKRTVTVMDNLRKEYSNWLRIAVLNDFAGRCLCHDVLFNKENLPKEGQLLFKELEYLKQENLFDEQREKPFPPNGITDYTTFDVTLLTRIIKSKYGNKYKLLVDDLRKARNKEFHRGSKTLSDNEFDQLWNEITNMLKQHQFDLQSVGDLKNCDIFANQLYRDIAISIQGILDRILLL